MIGADAGVGNPTLLEYFPDGIVKHNVIVGGHAGQYPPDNFFPSLLNDVGFRNWTGGDYRLADPSPYRKASNDRSALGVDFEKLCAAMPDTLSLPKSCVPTSPSDNRSSHNARPPDS